MKKCNAKKCLSLIAAGGGLLALALVVKRSRAGATATPGPTMWDKMEEAMASMPETFPPRVMFDNVVAIRQDTARIIEMLEPRQTASVPEPDDAS